jgi:hypothetical protein
VTFAEHGKPDMTFNPTPEKTRGFTPDVIEGGIEELLRQFETLVWSKDPEDVPLMIKLATRLDKRGTLRLVKRGELQEQSDPQGSPKS